MNKRIAAGLAVALIVLAVALGSAWLILRHVADSRLQEGIAQFRASLAPDGSFTYAHAEAAPLHLGAVFTDAAIHRRGMSMTAAQVALDRVGRNHVGSAQLRDVRFHGNGVTGTIASIDAGDLSDPGGGKPAAWSDLRVGRLKLHDLAVQLDTVPGAGARAADVGFSQIPDGHGGAVQDTRIQQLSFLGSNGQDAVAIDGLTQHSSGSPAAATVTTAISGLAILPDSALGQQLGQVGYRGAHGDGHSFIRFSLPPGAPARGRFDVDPLTIRLDGIGQLALTLGLDHVPPVSQPGATVAQRTQQMAQAQLRGLTLTYEDSGLTAHVLERLAQRSGMTVVQLRAALEQTLQQRAVADGGLGFEQQAIQFLNDPRRVVIVMHPPAPITLSDLAALQGQRTPADAIQALGLSVKAD